MYVLIPGFSFSLMYGLPESIAASLLIAGFYFSIKKKFLFSCVCFALSLLFRETGVLFIGIVGLLEARQSKAARDALKIWISVIPYLIWRLYVTVKLLPDKGWNGFFEEPPNLTIPFKGVIELLATIFRGEYEAYIVPAGILFPLLLFAAAMLAIR